MNVKIMKLGTFKGRQYDVNNTKSPKQVNIVLVYSITFFQKYKLVLFFFSIVICNHPFFSCNLTHHFVKTSNLHLVVMELFSEKGRTGFLFGFSIRRQSYRIVFFYISQCTVGSLVHCSFAHIDATFLSTLIRYYLVLSAISYIRI